MTETELKLQVPPARVRAVAAAVGTRAARTQRLQAVYVDSAERALARAGIALRLRREGPRWVQTLKALGTDRLQRLEHNVPRAGAAARPPAVDPALHAGTPAGARLEAVLRGLPPDALQPVFRTDIRRTVRALRVRGGLLELALDRGRILAGGQALPVCELEIELLRGAPALVIAQSRRWVARHGLWLDLQSKAERGERLARGEAQAPAVLARPPAYPAGADAAAGRRAVLAACAEQVLDNAGPVAAGTHGDEHVHQLRVGLRRLRSALRLFDGERPDDPLAAGAAGLFGRLGAARDQAAIAGPLRGELQRALAALGLDLAAPALPAAPQAPSPAELLRAPASQALLLDLLQALQPPEPALPDVPAAPLRGPLVATLQRWHKQVAAQAPRFAELDDDARHRLRKRVKRLRYAVEFAAPLFEARKVRRYLQPLRALQDRLGAFNDVCVGLAGYRGAAGTDAASAFALGWLAARREQRLAECAPALQALARAKRFWKKA